MVDCNWQCEQYSFCSNFKVLPLQEYDGILGMDWLASHSPQVVDWHKKWLAFQYQGSWICLQGQLPSEFSCAVIEVQLLSEEQKPETTLSPDIQQILDSFPQVFSEPTGLEGFDRRSRYKESNQE